MTMAASPVCPPPLVSIAGSMSSIAACVTALVDAAQGVKPIGELSKTGRRQRMRQAARVLGALLGEAVQLRPALVSGDLSWMTTTVFLGGGLRWRHNTLNTMKVASTITYPSLEPLAGWGECGMHCQGLPCFNADCSDPTLAPNEGLRLFKSRGGIGTTCREGLSPCGPAGGRARQAGGGDASGRCPPARTPLPPVQPVLAATPKRGTFVHPTSDPRRHPGRPGGGLGVDNVSESLRGSFRGARNLQGPRPRRCCNCQYAQLCCRPA